MIGGALPRVSYGSGLKDAKVTAVIALHEIGHSMGLKHRAGANIMAPDAIARAFRGELLTFDTEQLKKIQERLRRRTVVRDVQP
jgi:hypothetical protein